MPYFRIAEFLQSRQAVSMRTALTVSSRGVVTLPAKLRRALRIKPNDLVIAETTPEGLLLRPAVTLPVELYTPERIAEFDAEEAALDEVLKPATRRRAKVTRAPRKRRR